MEYFQNISKTEDNYKKCNKDYDEEENLEKTMIQNDFPNLDFQSKHKTETELNKCYDNLFIDTVLKPKYKSVEEYELEISQLRGKIQELEGDIKEIKKKHEYEICYIKNMKNNEIQLLNKRCYDYTKKISKMDSKINCNDLNRPLLGADNLSEQEIFKVLEDEGDKKHKTTFLQNVKQKAIRIKNKIKKKFVSCRGNKDE